jgi:hypothetical protein
MASQRLSAYIDAANLFHGGNFIDVRIDYEKFKPIILNNRTLVDLNFYDCTQNLPQQTKFFQKISNFGYNLKLTRIHIYNGSAPEEKKELFVGDFPTITEPSAISRRRVTVKGEKRFPVESFQSTSLSQMPLFRKLLKIA